VYAVVLDDGRAVDASLRGRLKQSGNPVVIGDRVSVTRQDTAWTIESVEERASALVRRGRGGRAPKVLAANLDRVFAVVALAGPPATTETVDRLLVMIEASGIHPVLVLNKVDLEGAAAAAERLVPLYEGVGYRTLVVSARTGEGLEPPRAMLCEGTSALVGPSGVGKSSLLNALDPDLELRTGALSGKTGTGRHTTVSSRLIRLACGGAVADTPGFGEVALWGVAPDEVASCFPELAALSAECRFRSCTHVHEPDCEVRAALAEGRIHESRYRSYRKLRDEAAEAAVR
jgi:ribosome biogenesis GTPase / thiamine phosphate phosphatase